MWSSELCREFGGAIIRRRWLRCSFNGIGRIWLVVARCLRSQPRGFLLVCWDHFFSSLRVYRLDIVKFRLEMLIVCRRVLKYCWKAWTQLVSHYIANLISILHTWVDVDVLLNLCILVNAEYVQSQHLLLFNYLEVYGTFALILLFSLS